MRINNKSLFGILQVALGLKCINNDLVDGFEDEEWREIFSFVSQQGVSAIALLGIENLGMKPPHSILMKWIGVKRATELFESARRVSSVGCSL